MPKAKFTLPDGTVVTIEGTTEEVARLLKVYAPSGDTQGELPDVAASKKTDESKTKRKTPRGPTGHIRALIKENFFKSRRTLPDIQKKLEEQGHIYAQSSLSPVLVRLVRNRELRRLKDKKGWVYVS
jgi:hypothetical protein